MGIKKINVGAIKMAVRKLGATSVSLLQSAVDLALNHL